MGKILLTCLAELGFACVIAVIIIFAVDRREKLELREYLTRSDRRLTARNLLAYASDLDIPDEISREIEHYLSATPFIKIYQNFTISLKKIDDERVQVCFQTVVEYMNISQSDKELDQETWLSRPTLPEPENQQQDTQLQKDGIVSFHSTRFDTMTSEWVPVSSKDFSEQRPHSHSDKETNEVLINPGGRVKVSIGAEKYHPISGADDVRQKFLCQKMKFDFVFDKSEFELETLLFCSEGDEQSTYTTPMGMTVEPTRPFLLNNGVKGLCILFRWC